MLSIEGVEVPAAQGLQRARGDVLGDGAGAPGLEQGGRVGTAYADPAASRSRQYQQKKQRSWAGPAGGRKRLSVLHCAARLWARGPRVREHSRTATPCKAS